MGSGFRAAQGFLLKVPWKLAIVFFFLCRCVVLRVGFRVKLRVKD